MDSSEGTEIISTIVNLADNLGMKVIAEGVEERQQADRLRELGCDFGQGYLFSAAVPVARFEELLSDMSEAS